MVEMDGLMDIWIDGWMDGQMDGWMYGWMDGCMDGMVWYGKHTQQLKHCGAVNCDVPAAHGYLIGSYMCYNMATLETQRHSG